MSRKKIYFVLAIIAAVICAIVLLLLVCNKPRYEYADPPMSSNTDTIQL
jgi:hypothetical protein